MAKTRYLYFVSTEQRREAKHKVMYIKMSYIITGKYFSSFNTTVSELSLSIKLWPTGSVKRMPSVISYRADNITRCTACLLCVWKWEGSGSVQVTGGGGGGGAFPSCKLNRDIRRWCTSANIPAILQRWSFTGCSGDSSRRQILTCVNGGHFSSFLTVIGCFCQVRGRKIIKAMSDFISTSDRVDVLVQNDKKKKKKIDCWREIRTNLRDTLI